MDQVLKENMSHITKMVDEVHDSFVEKDENIF